MDFTDNIRIHENLVTDGAGEFSGRATEFVKKARIIRIRLHTLEQGHRNQNQAAEREIVFPAKCWRARMNKKNVPQWIWDFGLLYESELLSRMARGRDLKTGYEEVTGDTAKISKWIDFEMYDIIVPSA